MADTGEGTGDTVLLVGQGDRLADCGRLLTWLGCTWETVETLPRAIERVVAWVPDLVLLDGEALTAGEPYWPLLTEALQHRRLPWLFLVPRATGLAPLCTTLDIGQADCLEWPLRDIEAIARLSLHLKMRRLEQELAEQHQALRQVTRQLDRLVELDGLKLAADRDEFTRQLRREWQRMIREAHPMALVLAAIDHWGLYRERYGRQRSELSLRQVAAAIARWVRRPADTIALYRPDTFALLLPETDAAGAATVAHNARQAIAELALPFDTSPHGQVSLSVGIAATVPAIGSEPGSLLQSALHALDKAQQIGGDRLVAAPEPKA